MNRQPSLILLILAMALSAQAFVLAQASTGPTTATTAPAGDPTAASLVTLKLTNANIDDVLAAVGKQVGYSLRPLYRQAWNRPGNELPKITVDYQDMPYWEVVRDICNKAKIVPYVDGPAARQLLFMPAANMGGVSPFSSPVSINGAMLSSLQNLSRQNTVNYSPHFEVRNEFTGSMTVLVEPRVPLTHYGGFAAIDEAVDDRGNSLVPVGNAVGKLQPAARQSQLSVNLRLSYPARNAGTRIARLRGRTILSVATRVQKLEFDQVMNGKEQTGQIAGGPRVILHSVKIQNLRGRANPRIYHAVLTFERNGMDAGAFRTASEEPLIRCLDANGRDLMFQHVPESNSTANQAKMTVAFYRRTQAEGDDVGEPAKIVWEYGLEHREIAVPFEFNDLPMP